MCAKTSHIVYFLGRAIVLVRSRGAEIHQPEISGISREVEPIGLGIVLYDYREIRRGLTAIEDSV